MIRQFEISKRGKRCFSVCLPQFKGLIENREKTAIFSRNNSHTFSDLLHHSNSIANQIRKTPGFQPESHVAFIAPPSFEHAATKYGIWLSGGVSVPLCTAHPKPEIQYVIEDSQAKVVIAHKDYSWVREVCGPNVTFLEIEEMDHVPTIYDGDITSHARDLDQRALLIYTSGTTGRPKGAVWTHRRLNNQIDTLLEAWQWSSTDHLIHCLPLHHIHGIVNKMLCCLKAGASITFTQFEARGMWDLLRARDDFTLFMGVPTVYIKLIQAFDRLSAEEQHQCREALSRLRLMISGSASLPSPIFDRWKEISGHTLLERYGMTEIGMALTNSYEPTSARIGGSVGFPFPGVETCMEESGELLVKSDAMFSGYWNKPEANEKSFVDDWFKTGDIVRQDETGRFFIQGRESQDIIKTFGFKVSALEVERELLAHPSVRAASACGLPSETYGEVVAVAIELKDGAKPLSLREAYTFLKTRLPQYSLPRHLRVLDQIPRNVMGKVNKIALREVFNHH